MVEFIPFDWPIVPADPNDLLLGQIVSPGSAAPTEKTDGATILFGLPFDGAVFGRKGAAAGPHAIRTQARTLKACSYALGELYGPVFDLGDVKMAQSSVAVAHEAAEAAARKALEVADAKKLVVALGGDHSLTYPCALPYLQKFRDKLAVINLDAHLDVREVAAGKEFNSGTSFARLLDAGLRTYVCIGARDFHTSTKYVQRVKVSGGRVLTAVDVFSRGPAVLAQDVLASLPPNCEAIYLSVDIDVADASVAPGVSAPTPGGLLAHQLLELARLIASDRRTIAGDVMELAPALEPGSDRTARLAAGVLAELIGAAQSKGKTLG